MESQIADYVHRSLDKGYSVDQIKKRLMHAGWTEEQLDKMPVFRSRETKIIEQITDIEKNFEDYKAKYDEERKRLAHALAEIEENRKSLEKKHEAYNNELSEIEKIKDRLRQKETEIEKREKEIITKEEGLSHKNRHLQSMHDTLQKRTDQIERLEKEMEHKSAMMINEKLELIRALKGKSPKTVASPLPKAKKVLKQKKKPQKAKKR
jgi:chromosome segregation ATPase